MREAIGGTWLVQIVILFVLLFTGFMCLTINHAKAFNVKNAVINAIERYDGADLSNPKSDPAISQIIEYMQRAAYRTVGKCPTGYTGYDRNGDLSSKNPAFCLRKQNVRADKEGFPDMSYYSVVVFYQLDLPIFSSTFNFSVTGDTKIIDIGSD